MKYVYLLRSVSNPVKRYIGVTSDFPKRLRQHNAGQSPHTSKHKPWNPVVVIRFEDDARAEGFEEYLKGARATRSPKDTSGERSAKKT